MRFCNFFKFFLILTIFFTTSEVFGGTGISFISTIKSGDSGPSVLALQKILNSDPDTTITAYGSGSPGNETEYFGEKTKQAVIRFQEKYKSEILLPSNLSRGTGFVGQKTLEKLNQIISLKENLSNKPNVPKKEVYTNNSPFTPENNRVVPSLNYVDKKPVVYSVYPDRLRRGDKVTIVGENFTSRNNKVTLSDGLIEIKLDNLKSDDGTTMTFVYEPPFVKTMSANEIRSLPANFVAQIENPLKEAGLTLETVMESYNKIKSESELEDILEKNGSSFDDMYHYFFMVVENSNGSFLSKNAMVHGIRRMPFDTVAKSRSKEMMSFLGKGLTAFFEKITSTAEAQGMGMNGGGFTTGIVMVCTCDANVLTFQLSFSGGGSGLYSLSPGFMPNAGSGRVAGPWLGGYQMMSGQCKIYAVYTCITIPANVPVKPVGYAF